MPESNESNNSQELALYQELISGQLCTIDI